MEDRDTILSSLHIILDKKNYTYKEIFENHKSLNFGNFIISLEPLGRYFSLKANDEKYHFFLNPLTINIQKENNAIKTYNNIYSYEQLKTLIDKNELDYAYIKTIDNHYERLSASNITMMISDNIYNITIEIKPINEIKNQPFLITKDKQFKPEDLTSKFYEYFKYNNESEKNNFFEFVITKEREKLFGFLNSLKDNDDIYIFKLTGPSSNGKSTTLLYYSRTQANVFYFNLSYLLKREINNDYISIFNAIYDEMERLYFPPNSNKNEIYQLLQEQNGKKTWEIISFLVNHLHKNNDILYIFILDQFKSTNVDKNIYNSLLNKIKYSNIKFIVCSSINDLDIKSEYKKTIIKFKGNPKSLNNTTQNYYFYFIFLYQPKYEIKDKYYLLFRLFGFLQKYQNIFKNSKIEELNEKINDIDMRIDKKLREYESSSLLINLQETNLYDSLMTIIQNINKDISYKELIRFYDILPLKYFYFEFKPNNFRLHYLFEYIIIFINKKNNNANYKAFFEKEDFMNEGIKSNIKGPYFEKSVIKSIKENKIEFENKYQSVIKLNEICSMDYEVKDKLSQALKRIISNDNSKIIDDDMAIDNIKEKSENKINENISEEDEAKIEDNIKDNLFQKEEKGDITAKQESNRISDIINERFEKAKEIIDKNCEDSSRDFQKFLSEKTYKDNLLDINDFKNNIQLFQKINDKKRKRIANYENNSILIEQDKINGRCLDMAMIWTNMNNKNIFIGFQMKCFKEDTKGGNISNISKMLIKCNYLDILMNSKDLLGIEIDEWHYIMILFCSNKDEKKNEICKYLVNKCIKNRLKYLFYDPVEELFYDKDLKPIKGVFSLLDEYSNLDYGNNLYVIDDNLNKSPGTFFLGKKHKLSSGDLVKEYKENIQSFKAFLKENSISFLKFKNGLQKLFNDIDKIEFIGKISTLKLELLTPSIGSIFCYQGNNKEILIIIKRDDEKGVEYYNFKNKKSYNILWEFGLDLEEINYFYLLNFIKK